MSSGVGRFDQDEHLRARARAVADHALVATFSQYKRCEQGLCNCAEVGRGVLLEELLDRDGPFPAHGFRAEDVGLQPNPG